MIYTIQNSAGLKLVDSTGTAIGCAYEFNDETFEVKFYLRGQNQDKPTTIRSGTSFEGEGYEIVKCSAIIKGAKMVSK